MPPGELPDKSDPAFWNRLYRQNPDGTFTDVTEKAGVTGHAAEPLRHGRRGRRLRQRRLRRSLRHRLRRQHALPQQRRRHVRGRDARAGVAAGGVERQRRLLRLRQRRPARPVRDALRRLELPRTTATAARSKPGYRAYCHPDNFEGHRQHPLSQQRRRHVHRRLARRPASPAPSGKGLGVAFADYDATGSSTCTSPTIRCSRSCIRNNGNGTFTEVGLLAGVGFNEDGKTFAGMGVDFADYDNDGRPDVVRHRPVERALPAVSPERRRHASAT